MRPWSIVLRGVGMLALISMLVFAALLASAAYHSQLPLARRVAANWLDDVISHEIRGALVITRFERLTPVEVAAGDVILFDGDGRRIAIAKRVVLRPDWSESWKQGHVVVGSARLESATVRLVDEGHGLPTFISTFDSEHPSPTGQGGQPMHVTINGIEVLNTTLLGDLLGLNGFRADDLHARGQLDIAGEVSARIDHAHATMTQPFGYPADIDRLNGRISGEGVMLHVRAHRGKETARGTVRYAPPKDAPRAEPRLQVKVRARGVSVSTLHGLGYDWVPDLAVPVSGQLELEGPTEDLSLQAAVDTQAGHADVQGSIATARGVSVTLSSQEGLALARLFRDYPPVTARGTLRIESPVGAEVPLIHAEVEPLVYETIAVPGFSLDGALVAKGVRIDRMTAQSKTARLSGHGRIANDGSLELDMRATFPEIGDDPNLKRLVPDARGRLEAQLQIGSEQIGKAKLRFAGSLKLSHLRYDMLSADRLELRGSARGDPDHPRVDLKVSGAQVKLGDYVLGDPSLTLAGGPSDYAADGQFASAGKRTFNVHAQVHAQADGFMIDADPIEFTVGEGSWRGAMQSLHVIRGKGVELGLLRFANRSQRLEARGVLRFDGEDQLQAELQNFDLAALRALLGTKLGLTEGFADAHVELRGDISNPQLRLQGALRQGVIKDVRDIGVLYLVTYSAGGIELSGEVDLGTRGLLRVDGTGQIDRTLSDPEQALMLGSYQLALSAEDLDIGLLPAAHAAGVRGTLAGEMHWSGTLQQPAFDGRVALAQLTIGEGSPLAVDAEGGFAGGELRLRFSLGDERGALASAGAQMELDWGALRADPNTLARALSHGPWQISGESSERRLDRMPTPLGKLVPYPLALATHFDLRKQSGATSGTVSFTSRWDAPVVTEGCAASVHALARGRVELDKGTSRAALAIVADNVEVGHFDVTLDTPVDRWVEGHFDTPRSMRASGRLDVADMQKLPYVCEYGSGQMHAQLELDNALTEHPTLSISADSQFTPRVMRQQGRTQLSARGCEDDPIRMHLYASADPHALSGSGSMQGCHGGVADLAGRLPVRWDRLRFFPTPRDDEQVQALLRFDGAHLEPLLDRIPGVLNATAIARGQISLSGPCSAVRASGQLDVSDGRIYMVATGQQLTDIAARVEFRGDWAKIDSLHASAGKGALDVSGGVGFDDLRPNRVRVAVHLRRFPIKREGVETAQLTGTAALDADIQPDITRAVIDLHDLAVRLPETTNRQLQPLDPNPDVNVVTRVEKPQEKSYPIELAIHGAKGMSVARNDFEAAVTTDLAVRWAPPEFNVGGYIAFTGGEFEVFGKRFQINSGALRFDGEGGELDPDVYLSATEKPQAAGLSPVSVSVTGTMSEPVVKFSSDVCPGEQGAITYLISGRCAADDPDLAQESADAQGAFTSGIVGGVLTLGAQRQLKGIAPRIAVGRSEQGGQRVAAGFATESLIPKFMRKLVHRVYVEGGVSGPPSAQTPGAENTTQSTALEFLIELYFPHNIVGSGRFGPVSWGADVIWEP